VGIGIGCAYVPAVGAVQPWFQRRRGLASGIAVAGIGGGTLAVPPLVAVLIEWAGWRPTYLALAVVTLVAGGIAALLLDNRPDRRGIGPDGDPIRPTTAAARAPGLDLRAASRTRPFRLMLLVGFCNSFGIFVPFVHLSVDAIDHGVAPTAAATLIGLIGAGSLAGRFALGAVADRIGRRHGLALTVLGQASMFLLWVAADSYPVFVTFAIGYGLCYGGFVALVPSVCMDYFGGRSIGAVLGTIYSGVAIGCLVGAPITGFAYDFTGSYSWPLIGWAITTALGALAAARLPAPRPPTTATS
jgi:MFS family permease